MNLGKSIKHALIDKGLKTKDLAEKMDVSPSYVSFLANNKKKASLKTVIRLSTALDYKLSEFIALGEEKTASKVLFKRRFYD